MIYERFSEILNEYDFSQKQIKLLWDKRPSDDIHEAKLRETAKYIAPMKDRLIQE